MTANQRQSERYNVEIPVGVRIGDETHQCLIQNLSLGGVFVAMGARLSMDTHVELNFRIPTHEREIVVGGRVRWCTESGAGIQFDGLRAAEVFSLNDYFSQLSGS